MSNRVFVDTSFFVALADESETSHGLAKKVLLDCISKKLSLYTSDYVLDELVTFMRCTKKEPFDAVFSFIKKVDLSEIRLFGITQDIFADALILMGRYKDHFFSMTDCVNFMVMKDLQTKDVLTLDKDFTIAGFNDLMRLAI